MGTYFPMSEDRREEDDTSTMLYLRDPLPINSQTQTPVLTTNTTANTNNVVYMNFSSSSGPYSDSLAASNSHIQPLASDSNSQVLLSFGLSLGSHGPSVMQIQYPNENPHYASILGCNNAMMSGEDRGGRNLSFENGDSAFHSKQSRGDEYVISRGLGSGSDGGNDYGALSVGRGVPNSKYLKAAQELLDEVVNVKQAIKEQNAKKESGKEVEGESGDNKAMDCSSGKAIVSELSVVEKHELQNKLTKLLSMLDEVDRRYRQYYHQMQIVMSSFDVIAGSGASKPYTALALQTISRHFRCLRDAINGQINVARKSLGEEDSGMNNNNRGVGISRLRFVDQQLRQQRALQQLGMIQQHAWRPQRGLPESSVSILRAWLFEHFLHPYPKDSDKIMLARQTGLTRSQVSNWFINARVRLWKPMVEEMYKEEAGDADMDSNSSSETIPKAASKAATKTSKEKADDVDSKSDQMMNEEMMTMMQDESENNYSQRPNPFPDGVIETSSGNDCLIAAAYRMSELERFANARSGVSLTLGLQQCEGGSMAVDPGFVTIGDADVYNSGPSGMGPETEEFECLDSSSRPHQFVTSLLPSFS